MRTPIKQVYSAQEGSRRIQIYKRASDSAPYHVKVLEKGFQPRNFYVIRYASDIFSYLMVEKNGPETFYYPLVWSALETVTLQDLKSRSREILSGKIPRVQKEDL